MDGCNVCVSAHQDREAGGLDAGRARWIGCGVGEIGSSTRGWLTLVTDVDLTVLVDTRWGELVDRSSMHICGGSDSIAEMNQLVRRAAAGAFEDRTTAIAGGFAGDADLRVLLVYDRFVLFSRRLDSGGSLLDARQLISKVAAARIRSRQQEAGRERL